MQSRAEAMAGTGEKILDAVDALLEERRLDQITLAEVARRSGITVQTVLRHYGSRDGMLAAALVRLGLRMGKDRDSARPGDVEHAVGILVDHYEEFGDRILLLLANEDREPFLRTLADAGRRYHREWCEEVFAPALAGLAGVERKRRTAQLVVAADIYTWKLLRRGSQLSIRQTKLAIGELLEPLMRQRA